MNKTSQWVAVFGDIGTGITSVHGPFDSEEDAIWYSDYKCPCGEGYLTMELCKLKLPSERKENV